MKLLFDQNLSFKLCDRLADLFPDSNQVRLAGLDAADDRAIWEFAKANGLTIVSQDSDFADMAAFCMARRPKSSGCVAAINRTRSSKSYSATIPTRSSRLKRMRGRHAGSFIKQRVLEALRYCV